MPVLLKTHCPHIWQSNNAPLTSFSTAATGFSSRAWPMRCASGEAINRHRSTSW
jgi:hypothetical protein